MQTVRNGNVIALPKLYFRVDSNVARGPLAKQPVLLILALCVILWLVTVMSSFINLLYDHYFPYEGTVVRIGSHWTDHVTFETTLWDHLTIKTPQDNLIDKVVSRQHRLLARIAVGDRVMKLSGFSNAVHPSDKQTTTEMIQSMRQ